MAAAGSEHAPKSCDAAIFKELLDARDGPSRAELLPVLGEEGYERLFSMLIQRIIELRAAFQQSGPEDTMLSSSHAKSMEPNDWHPVPDDPVSMQGGKMLRA